MSLAPYNRYLACIKCGRAFSHAEKPLVVYCPGTVPLQIPPGAPPRDQVCDLGGPDEHLHRKCSDCGFQWAEACIESEPPLTADEIRLLRAALSKP